MSKATGFRLGAIHWAAVLCCLGMNPGQTSAADFQARWSELPSLLTGYQVQIPLQGGAVVEGELVSLRPDALVLDVSRVSGTTEYRKGFTTIPRASVTTIRASKSSSGWGRRMGAVVGQIVGLVGGAEIAAHVGRSEAAGVPLFLTVNVGATAAGYYLGRSRDKHTLEIAVEPALEGKTEAPETILPEPQLARRPPEQ